MQAILDERCNELKAAQSKAANAERVAYRLSKEVELLRKCAHDSARVQSENSKLNLLVQELRQQAAVGTTTAKSDKLKLAQVLIDKELLCKKTILRALEDVGLLIVYFSIVYLLNVPDGDVMKAFLNYVTMLEELSRNCASYLDMHFHEKVSINSS